MRKPAPADAFERVRGVGLTLPNVEATTKYDGSPVLIVDAESRYVLRYDAESGHLRGTRNGAPFWAARQIIARAEACPGIP